MRALPWFPHLRRLLLVTTSVLVGISSTARAEGLQWLTDIEAAKKEAAKTKKDLLLDFTGSDWCVWCVRLKNEVFDKDEFVKEAPKHFVFVELDFPRDKSKVPEATQKQNQEWMEKLGVQGFPTIFLTDAQGRPYGRTGYQPGGPEKYLTHLAEFREGRVKMEQSLTAAEGAQGAERAKRLDAALSVLDDSLVLVGYRPLVEEILQLDGDDEAGLKTKYADKLNAEEVRKAVAVAQRSFDGTNLEEVLKGLNDVEEKYAQKGQARVELGKFKAMLLLGAQKPDEAKKVAVDLLKTEGLESMAKVELTMLLVRVLSQEGNSQEILTYVDGLLGDESLPAQVRTQLLAQKARTLGDLDKTDEALKVLDTAIEKEDDGNMKFRLQITKGELLARAGRKEDAAKAFDAAVEAVDDDNLKEQIKLYKERVLTGES